MMKQQMFHPIQKIDFSLSKMLILQRAIFSLASANLKNLSRASRQNKISRFNKKDNEFNPKPFKFAPGFHKYVKNWCQRTTRNSVNAAETTKLSSPRDKDAARKNTTLPPSQQAQASPMRVGRRLEGPPKRMDRSHRSSRRVRSKGSLRTAGCFGEAESRTKPVTSSQQNSTSDDPTDAALFR